MQPEVDMIAMGGDLHYLGDRGRWGSYLLVAFEFFYYQLAVPPLPCPTLCLWSHPASSAV